MEIIPAHDEFFHVRVIVGIVTGLAVARLLSALARAVTPAAQGNRDTLQLSWTVFLTLYVVHYWWFEYGFSRNAAWDFETYAFVLAYAALLYFASAVLLPDGAKSMPPGQSYVIEIRHWFFPVLILMILFDIIDTELKGQEYFRTLGVEYLARQVAIIVAAAAATFIRSPWYHGAFVAAAVISQFFLIFSLYRNLA